MFIFAISRS